MAIISDGLPSGPTISVKESPAFRWLIFSVEAPIDTITHLLPRRHYYMIYQMNIFNGFPMGDSVLHWGALVLFCALPMLTIWNIKKAMLVYKYLP